ncbi:peroxidase [Beijerinckiaceae bacterium]|nr:peroxidase [Beijerinckiaceae bacterium]
MSRHHHQDHDTHSSVQFRSIDGSGNNLADLTLNQAGTDFTRLGPANFADGFAAMQPGPNPREISNIVVAGGPVNATMQVEGTALSSMMSAWGQFMDHDLDLQKGATTQDISVIVPPGDSHPAGTIIPLTRVAIDPATGVPGHPATAINTITGWLDGSMVYGSSKATADSMRLPDGHMKTSAGDNLPIVDTVQGPAFVAGDARAQENPNLTALQTLFIREHNYQVDQLHKEHPNWSGEQLYQNAKAITTAEIANITYNEFLPHLLGPNAISAYHGYDPSVNPTISEEFAGAAFRFGHSLVSDVIGKIDNSGATTESNSLKDVFFQPTNEFVVNGGADGVLRHLAGEAANPLDTHIVDGIRNFLQDGPGAIDLAATNIQRGHDLGLGTLNQTREALGLTPYTSFDQVSSDSATVAALKSAYGSVDNIDLWVGGLAEDHTAGASVGETFGKIIGDQFTALRDGDRFYFENQGFDSQTLKTIENTTLSDIISRDTDTTYIQADAFVAIERHSGTQAGIDPTGSLAGPGMAQLVIGSPGTDTLMGGSHNDTLIAARGQMTMTGGAGDDTFVFNIGDQGRTYAKITDFDPHHDTLEFQTASKGDCNKVHVMSDHHGGTLVVAGQDRVDLVGVHPNQVHTHDILFA